MTTATATTRTASLSEADLAEWRAGNAGGEGYAVGDDGDTPEQAARREGLEIVEVDDEGRVLAHADGRRIIICDANGPWAVAIGRSK